MADFLDQLQTGIAACGLGARRILLGVSGGPDSMALLRGMLHYQRESRLELYVGHVNHQLRGDEADADEHMLRRLADQWNLPLAVERVDVAATAAIEGRGIEETARTIRYAFLSDTATAHRCSHVAVAHTADDQVETVLHHALRGTGLSGLRGMSWTRPLSEHVTLARPLLATTRAEVERYLEDLGQDYRHDATNDDQSYTRSRIRQSLLPLLERDFNPQVRDALLRLSQQAGDAQSALEFMARGYLESAVVDCNSSVCRLDCGVLVDLPVHLIRECFALVWKRQAWPRQRMGFADWNRLAELVSCEGTATLPCNIQAARRGNLLVLRSRE